MNTKEQKNIEAAVASTSTEIFANKLKKLNSFYFQLVVLCSVVAVATVTVALLASYVVGVIVAVALVLIYLYFSRDEIKRSLGIVFSINGINIKVRELRLVIDSDGFIPSRLMWYDVTEISAGILDNEKTKTLKRLYIPKTVSHIEKGAFDGCKSLTTLCFEHSEAEFAELTVEDDLSRFTLEFCVSFSDTTVEGGAK